MATILVKGIPPEVLKELKRLKVEMNCKTWAELLEKLAESRGQPVFSEEEMEEMRVGVKGFLKLADKASKRWSGPPSVVEEFRKSRDHDGS